MPIDPLFIRFLGWLKKNKGRQYLSYCLKKWQKHGLTEDKLQTLIDTFSRDHLRQYRKPSDGGKIVEILDLDWVDRVLIEYEEEIPGHIVKRGHHGQFLKWKK